MSQAGKTGVVEGRDQYARCDAHRLVNVVMFPARPFLVCPPSLQKDTDQPRRDFEQGFARIGS